MTPAANLTTSSKSSLNPNETRLEVSLEMAIEHHQKGDLSTAKNLYQVILDRQPHHAAALHGLGAVYYQLQEYDRAVERLGEAVYLEDKNPIFRNTLGMTYRAQGLYEKACWQYRAGLEQDPENQGLQLNLSHAWADWLGRDRQAAIDFLASMAHLYHRINRPAAAEKLYRQLIDHDTQNADGWHGLGLLAYNRQAYDQAQQLMHKAINFNQKNATYYHNLGLVYEAKGLPGEAIQCYENALNCNFHLLAPREQFEKVTQALADRDVETLKRVLWETGQHWETRENIRLAQLIYARLDALCPKLPDVNYALGRLCFIQHESYDAIQNFLKAIEQRPNTAEYHRALAMAHHMHSLPGEALKHLKRALELEPENPDVQRDFNLIIWEVVSYFEEMIRHYIPLGNYDRIAQLEFEAGNFIKEHTGKIKAALRYYHRAIEANPSFPDVHRTLAELYLEEKEYQTAHDAIRNAIQAKPDDANAYRLLGNALLGLNNLDGALNAYQRALAIQPNYAQALSSLGNVLLLKNQVQPAIEAYSKAIALDGSIAEIHWNAGKAYERAGQNDATITAWLKTFELNPNYGDGDCERLLGLKFYHTGKREEAVHWLNRSIARKPDNGAAHWTLCEIFNHSANLAAARAYSLKYYENVKGDEKVMAGMMVMKSHVNSGVSHVAIDFLKQVEPMMYKMLENPDYNQAMRLYLNMGFDLPHIRDDVPKNAQLIKLMAEAYRRYLDAKAQAEDHYGIEFPRDTTPDRPLRIGFMSKHFRRHSVGWLSVNIIEELVKITPHVFCYVTGDMNRDHLTERFDAAVERFYHPPSASTVDYLREIAKDKLDVLVDMDGVTVMPHLEILHRHPAPLCATWLGFDAPYISPKHYYLGDRYTHPDDVDQYYLEQVIRLPDSFAAIEGLPIAPVDRETIRKSMRIAPNQIAYLCVATGNKFCPEMVSAQIEILKRVPDSLLLYKGRVGDLAAIEQIYKEECQKQGVRTNRIRVLPRTATEEEHRLIYQFADILIDSYPYSGATHVVEALCFNMPVVAKVADQSFGRQAYSLIHAAGSDMGIAFDWETYIDWSVRLGLDTNLRQQMRSQLEQGKRPETLAPLWNPPKFARDMYNIFEKLLPLQED